MLNPYVLTSSTASMTVLSSSFAISASKSSTSSFAISSSYSVTSSYASNTISSSYAVTSSYVLQAVSSSYTTFAQTASYITTAQTASFITASNIFGPYGSNSVISASYSNTSTSASYASNGGVTQLLAGSNITLSPTTGKGQVTISSTGGGLSFNTATGSYGSFYDTTTQTNPVASIPRSMSFNTTDISNGVSISGSTNPYNTYIKTENAGVYNIQFSAQFDRTNSGTDTVYIWLRKNGVDIAETNTSIVLTGAAASNPLVAAWNWFTNSAAGDYYQIMWASGDTHVRLLADSTPTYGPTLPSIILTVNRVDQFLSNTGSFTGSFTGTLTGTASYASQALSSSYATTSSYVLNAVSASYALTASYVLQALSASFATTALSSSYAVTSSYVLQAVSSSFATTASFATIAVSSSYTTNALSSSYASTASYVLQAVTASFATFAQTANTASYIVTAQTASYIVTAQTASYILQAVSASFANTASYYGGSVTSASYATTSSYSNTSISSSYALSASWAPGSATFPYNGDAQISGSLNVTGSFGIQTYDAFISNAFVNAIQITDTNRTIYDIFGNTSIDAGGRILIDMNAFPSVNWMTRTLFDSSPQQSIDWGNRQLLDSTGSAAINWDYNTQAQAVDIGAYTRKTLPLSTVVEDFSNFTVYGTFQPDGEILSGVNFDGSVADFDLVYLETDGKWYPVDMTTSSSSKLLGIAWGVGSGKEKVLLEGTMVVNDSALTDSPQVAGVDHGLPIYIKTSGGFYMSTSAPSTSGNYVRILGHAYYQGVGDANYWIMKFRPANDWYVI